jgi:hypothetical protein
MNVTRRGGLELVEDQDHLPSTIYHLLSKIEKSQNRNRKPKTKMSLENSFQQSNGDSEDRTQQPATDFPESEFCLWSSFNTLKKASEFCEKCEVDGTLSPGDYHIFYPGGVELEGDEVKQKSVCDVIDPTCYVFISKKACARIANQAEREELALSELDSQDSEFEDGGRYSTEFDEPTATRRTISEI